MQVGRHRAQLLHRTCRLQAVAPDHGAHSLRTLHVAAWNKGLRYVAMQDYYKLWLIACSRWEQPVRAVSQCELRTFLSRLKQLRRLIGKQERGKAAEDCAMVACRVAACPRWQYHGLERIRRLPRAVLYGARGFRGRRAHRRAAVGLDECWVAERLAEQFLFTNPPRVVQLHHVDLCDPVLWIKI